MNRTNLFPEGNGDTAQYSAEPTGVRFPKLWEHLTARQKRENLIDQGSIYRQQRKRQSLPRPGHRDVLTKGATDVRIREERNFLRRVTGYPMTTHISGSAHPGRGRRQQAYRQPTANTIRQEYQYLHNGMRGKLILDSKRFRDHAAAIPMGCHSNDDDTKAHFCEVLGQRACAHCIEDRNRQMAVFYQNRAFPAIEATAASLVAPKLSKSLTVLDRIATRRSGGASIFEQRTPNSSTSSPIPYRT